MPPVVNVRSIDALLELKAGLARYAHEVRAPLEALEHEAQSTLEQLAERRRNLQRQVKMAQQAVDAAKSALARCEAATYRDPKTGAIHKPDCSAYRAALAQANARLRALEDELRNVERSITTVEVAQAEFRREFQRLTGWLEREGAEAQTFLERKATSLQAYVAMRLPASYSVPAPTDVLTGLFTLGMVAGAIGLTSVALAAVRKLAGPLRGALGDAGETLTQKLLQQELGWRPLPFDQPKHGYDRVFTAPGLPLIVVESKVNRKGELRLGQPQSGEQGSPEWLAAQAARMADPDSAQHSPANAEIAALIEEIGPENVPVVAVVITTETGAVEVNFRRPGSTAWEKLPAEIDLTALLQEQGSPGGAEPTAAVLEDEGNLIGPVHVHRLHHPPESGWVNQGIRYVSVRELPIPEGIDGIEDFRKVTAEEMRRGVLCLQEMLPAIEVGTGANSDYWRRYDEARGLDPANGYQRIYDAFYGKDAITVTFDGEKYDIVNGGHRIWLAQQIGIDSLPMYVSTR